jgi:hypothetical protein
MSDGLSRPPAYISIDFPTYCGLGNLGVLSHGDLLELLSLVGGQALADGHRDKGRGSKTVG